MCPGTRRVDARVARLTLVAKNSEVICRLRGSKLWLRLTSLHSVEREGSSLLLWSLSLCPWRLSPSSLQSVGRTGGNGRITGAMVGEERRVSVPDVCTANDSHTSRGCDWRVAASSIPFAESALATSKGSRLRADLKAASWGIPSVTLPDEKINLFMFVSLTSEQRRKGGKAQQHNTRDRSLTHGCAHTHTQGVRLAVGLLRHPKPGMGPFLGLFFGVGPLAGLGVRNYNARTKFRALFLVRAHFRDKKRQSANSHNQRSHQVDWPKMHVVWHIVIEEWLLTQGKWHIVKMRSFRNFEHPHFCTVFFHHLLHDRQKIMRQGAVFKVFGTSWPILRLKGPRNFWYKDVSQNSMFYHVLSVFVVPSVSVESVIVSVMYMFDQKMLEICCFSRKEGNLDA